MSSTTVWCNFTHFYRIQTNCMMSLCLINATLTPAATAQLTKDKICKCLPFPFKYVCFFKRTWVLQFPSTFFLYFFLEENLSGTCNSCRFWAGCPSWHPTNSVKFQIVEENSEQWPNQGKHSPLSPFFTHHKIPQGKWVCFLHTSFLMSVQSFCDSENV